MTIKRRKAVQVKIGKVRIGSGNPISIQSMTKTRTRDTVRTIKEIRSLEKAGCEIIRVAVKNNEDALSIRDIKKRINIPLVADIHFDYKLALVSIDSGADAVRLNPGNINKEEHIVEVLKRAKKARIPIRIGVNSGSIKKRPKGLSEPDALVREALGYIKSFEKHKFYDIIISLKSSDVLSTIYAYKKMAGLSDYPFHIGVTATGVKEDGIIKSAIGIGSLLLEGIGDTVRVSLTSDPVHEVEAARSILQSLGLRNFGPEVISCPTCGRCQVDIEKIVKDVKGKIRSRNRLLPGRERKTIAIMGCEVNGPGEAKEAYVGIAAGKGAGMLFKKGKIVKRVKSKDFTKELLRNI